MYRVPTLQDIEAVKNAALETLVRFVDPEAAGRLATLAAAFEPRPEDYPRVFVASQAGSLADRYREVWKQMPVPRPKAGQTVVRVAVAPAGVLDTDNVLSAEFPGGYRRIARFLVPERLWVAWRFVEPDARIGMAYDGLVWLDGRWAWFPKPWRLFTKTE
jgi:hypothetical protein